MSAHKRLDQYIVLRSIGKGATAKVKAVEDPHTRQMYAAKIMKPHPGLDNDSLREIMQNEMENLNRIAHPNIVNLLCVNGNGIYTKRNGETKPVMYLLMELCPNGELFDILKNTGKFSEEISRFYFHQLIETLEAVHNAGIAHRDIKPENILFDRDFNLKISDFGFSTLLDRYPNGLLHTKLGTEGYMAPEIHQNIAYRGESIDLFSAGIVLFIMYAQVPPFKSAISTDTLYRLLSRRDNKFWTYHSNNRAPDFFSPDFKDLISNMLALDPDERLSIAQIKAHPWYNGPVASIYEITEELRMRREKIVEDAKEAASRRNVGNRPGVIGRGGRAYRGNEAENSLSLPIDDLIILPLPENFNAVNRYYKIITGLEAPDIVSVIAQSFCDLEVEWNPSRDKYEFAVTILNNDGDQLSFVMTVYSYQDDLNLISFKLTDGSKFEFMSIFKRIEDDIISAQENYKMAMDN